MIQTKKIEKWGPYWNSTLAEVEITISPALEDGYFAGPWEDDHLGAVSDGADELIPLFPRARARARPTPSVRRPRRRRAPRGRKGWWWVQKRGSGEGEGDV
jgi:hypothetical protein